MTRKFRTLVATSALALGFAASTAFAQTELRMTWYNDGIVGNHVEHDGDVWVL